MHPIHVRSIRAALFGLILASVTVSPLFAADPGASAQPLNADTPDFGIPAGYEAQKQAQLTTFLAGGRLPALPKKTGASSGSASALLAAASSSCTAWPCTVSLGYVGFHEQTKDWCLVAWVQSAAWKDISPSTYQYLGTGTVYGAQYKILHGYPNASDYIIGNYGAGPGAVDGRAIKWINNRYKDAGWPFYYVPELPSSSDDLMNYVGIDLSYYGEMTYIRIDLTNAGYAWQVSGTNYPKPQLHSTGVAGYNVTTGIITSYDPYSTPGSSDACAYHSYTSHDWGCTWPVTALNYLKAMDKGTYTPADNMTKPVWY